MEEEASEVSLSSLYQNFRLQLKLMPYYDEYLQLKVFLLDKAYVYFIFMMLLSLESNLQEQWKGGFCGRRRGFVVQLSE